MTFSRVSLRRGAVFALVALCWVTVFTPARAAERWVGTWATSPRLEEKTDPGIELAGATLRQVIHVSLGGRTVRLRLSNAFGTTPLVLHGVHLARAGAAGAIEPASDRAVRFAGERAVTVPAGAVMLSDPVELEFPALADLAISIHFAKVPAPLTGHPGSRTNSYLLPGDQLAAVDCGAAVKTVHWYFITGLDVIDPTGAAGSLVVLGDSITDGYGCTTDRNNRWTDELARRLQAEPATRGVGVLNHGIGGNRLLRDGLGPNALARFERDVLAQTGVRWLLILEGINDLGTRAEARTKGDTFASEADIIAAYDQMIARARTHGIRVIGATLLPYGGSKTYWSADGDEDRRTINEWIRTSGRFDAVIDFDAAFRSPDDPNKMKPTLDSGDHLHPSLAGYVEMARVVDLKLFTAPTASGKN